MAMEYVGDVTIPIQVIKDNQFFLQADQPIRLQYSQQIKSLSNKQNTNAIDCLLVCSMVFNATFNNISVISWRLVLLVEIGCSICSANQNSLIFSSLWCVGRMEREFLSKTDLKGI